MQIPKDSQIKKLFMLLGPAYVKAARKHVDEIDIKLLKNVVILELSALTDQREQFYAN